MAGWDTRPVNSGYTVIVGTTTGNYNNGVPDTYVKTWMEFKVLQDATDVANNRSRVDVKLYSQVITGGSSTGMANTYTANNYGYAGFDNSNRAYLNTAYDFNNFALNKFADTTLTIPHNADGTKTIALQAAFNTLSGTWSITGGSASTSLTLPPIAQKTEITSISGLGYGNATTFNLSRKASNLREKVYLINGGTTLLIKDTDNSATTFNYTLPYSYAPNTAAPSPSTWTVKVETYNGATLVGYIQTTCTFKIVDNAYKPTFSTNPSLSIYNDVVSAFGTYVAVAGYSKLRLSATKAQISTKYNATVVSRSVTFSGGGGTFSDLNASTYTSNKYTAAGDFNCTYTVTDSRGYTLTWTNAIPINFKAYSAPTLNVTSCYRGNSSHVESDSGTYAWGQASYNICSLKGSDNVERNSVSAFRAQVSGFSAVNLSNNTLTQLASGLSVSNTYTVTFTITDVTGTTATETRTIQSEDVPLHIREGGKGVGIGAYCEGEGIVNIGYKLGGALVAKGDRVFASVNKLDKSLIEQGDISGSNGAESASTIRLRSGWIPVKPSTTYTLSMSSSAVFKYLYKYSASKGWLRVTALTSASPKSFTTDNDVYYIRVTMGYTNDATIVPSDVSDVQLEQGSSKSLYVPYAMDNVELSKKCRGWRYCGILYNSAYFDDVNDTELMIVPKIQGYVFQSGHFLIDVINTSASPPNEFCVRQDNSYGFNVTFHKSGNTIVLDSKNADGWDASQILLHIYTRA